MFFRYSIVLVLVLIARPSQQVADKVVCYYSSWASYAGITPETFNANLCSHLNYAFIKMQEDGSLIPNDANLDITQGLYSRVAAMKNQNQQLKVLFSVGGGSEGVPELFTRITSDPAKRANFIASANDYISKYNFDGLDIDWEVPGASDKENFLDLLRELKNNFAPKNWLLTAAVRWTPVDGYDVPQLNELLNFINIMSYDFYGSWSQYTGQNSALYPSSVESSWEQGNLNLAAAGRLWLNAGASAQKLVIGTAFYGRSFTLSDPNQRGVHAPIVGVGAADEGSPKYSQICTQYSSWTRVWDDEQKNPIKYQGNQWLGYDDEQSITEKAKYIAQNFGGAMVWAIDQDDVKGDCGETQGLLKALNTGLRS